MEAKHPILPRHITDRRLSNPSKHSLFYEHFISFIIFFMNLAVKSLYYQPSNAACHRKI
jgi:hypothetical protein